MQTQPKTPVGRRVRRMVLVLLMVVMTAMLCSQSVVAQTSYVITDGASVTLHRSYSSDPDEVLSEAGIFLAEDDTYTTSRGDGVHCIDIQRMQMVTVDYRGQLYMVGTCGETVGSILERLGLELTENDQLSCSLTAQTYDGMELSVVHTEVRYETEEVPIDFETRYYEDPALAAGDRVILVEGVAGLERYTTQVHYRNGQEVYRATSGPEVIQAPVNALIVTGVDRSITEQPDGPDHVMPVVERWDANGDGYAESVAYAKNNEEISDSTITTVGGATYTYTRKITCLATAYSCEGYVGTTATGTVARVGAIAVDPRVIPLGTRMYVVSNDGEYVYGYCTAEDTGGLIKGYRLDLYFDTIAECYLFGARNCTVYILG